MRWLVFALIASLFVFAFAGCQPVAPPPSTGGGAPQAAAPGGGEEAATPVEAGEEAPMKLTITLVDYSFQPDPIKLKTGVPVEITLINHGNQEHEFLMGRNIKLEEGLAAGFEEDLLEHGDIPVEILGGEEYKVGEPEEIEEEGWHVELEPGGQVTFRFTLPEGKVGEWEMACFIPGHYDAGMHGKVIVDP